MYTVIGGYSSGKQVKRVYTRRDSARRGIARLRDKFPGVGAWWILPRPTGREVR